MKRNPLRRNLLLGAASALVILAAGVTILPRLSASAPGAIAIGGPFALVDGDGHAVTDRSFRGKWMLVYFGYTHCPDACPTALNDMATALDKMGPAAKDVVPVFITVDPDRDTPAVMKDYVSAFDAPITALSGSGAAVAEAEKSYRVYAAKHPTGGGDYEMDHSSIIYVMDPQGRFVTDFTRETPEQIAARLKQLGA